MLLVPSFDFLPEFAMLTISGFTYVEAKALFVFTHHSTVVYTTHVGTQWYWHCVTWSFRHVVRVELQSSWCFLRFDMIWFRMGLFRPGERFDEMTR